MGFKEHMDKTLTMKRSQYFLNFLIGFFAGCIFMFMFSLAGIL